MFNMRNLQGVDIAFMQSHEYADLIISEFKKRYYYGDPNTCLKRIMAENHITDGDLMDQDINRINREATKIYQSRRG